MEIGTVRNSKKFPIFLDFSRKRTIIQLRCRFHKTGGKIMSKSARLQKLVNQSDLGNPGSGFAASRRRSAGEVLFFFLA